LTNGLVFAESRVDQIPILVCQTQHVDEEPMASNPLRQKLKTILDTFDNLSRQSGTVEKEALLSALPGEVEVVEAEELIQHLVKEGILNSPRASILEKP
jgi:hypothetical protein